jgi:hypothetical protein
MIVSVGAAEALVVLLLRTALTGTTISRVARPLVACLGVSCAWGAWVLAVVVRAPWWMMAVTVGFSLLGSTGLGVAIHLATREEGGEAGGGDTGGGPELNPESPGGGGGDAQPEWWPDFERQLAAYAAQQERVQRSRQPVEC